MREGVYIQLNIAIETELGFLREASSRSVRVEGERTAVSLVYVSVRRIGLQYGVRGSSLT